MFILLLNIIISLLKSVQVVLGELVRSVEESRPPKQPSHCDVEDLLQVFNTCENGIVTRVKEQSIEVGPQVFQVVQEKQIGIETAVADNVFFGEDAIIANSRPFRSFLSRHARLSNQPIMPLQVKE